MTWVHVALAVLVTIIVLVIAVSRSYALGRESGDRDTLAGQGSDSGSLFGTDVPVREAEQGLIDVMPSEVIVCDGNGSVRCSSKSQVNVDVIENGWIVKDEILDILHVVVENGGVREREMCVSLDLTRMSSAISGRGVTAGSSAPSDSYLRVRVGHICDGLYAVFINDVTEQRRFERMRRDFVTNVSHELKTPLTSISGYAELIETGIAKPEDVPGFAQKIHVEASRMIQLVNDILQLSSLDNASEAGSEPEMETVDLLTVAKDCVERQKLNARRAYISLNCLGESALVHGNRALLDELCQNLCDNAIRYNRPGGKVQITTACSRDGHCTLTVADNGIGIPKEAQSSVFERFYRVDKSRSKATGGTGLGLAIVKHIARIHNARIKLESQVDVGTTITVTFPTAN